MRAYVARVDGQAVILVLDVGVGDPDAGGRTNVKGVGVVASLGISGGVVDGDVIKVGLRGSVDGECLNRRVLDAEP